MTSPVSGQRVLGVGEADHEQRGLHTFTADGEERQRQDGECARLGARAMSPRSWPDMPAAALRIQSTIVVTIATAISDATPAMASAPSPEMVFSPNWMARNTATVMTIAAPTTEPDPLARVAAVRT